MVSSGATGRRKSVILCGESARSGTVTAAGWFGTVAGSEAEILLDSVSVSVVSVAMVAMLPDGLMAARVAVSVSVLVSVVVGFCSVDSNV